MFIHLIALCSCFDIVLLIQKISISSGPVHTRNLKIVSSFKLLRNCKAEKVYGKEYPCLSMSRFKDSKIYYHFQQLHSLNIHRKL